MKYLIELKDKRNTYVLDELIKIGFNSCEFVMGESAVTKSDLLIFSPARKFLPEEVESLPDGVMIVCGNVPEQIKEIFASKNITHLNLLDDETFVVKNANLTAEGVLALVIKESEKSLYQNKIAILGTGRVGIAIAILLKALSVDFSLVTYHPEKVGYGHLFCDNVYLGDEFFDDIGDFDIILNTVPAIVLPDDKLHLITDGTIVMEIASYNCLNTEQLSNYNFRFVPAPALPKVFCPYSAGMTMVECIINILENL